MKRAVGYVRVSTSQQAADDKMSMDVQKSEIEKYCRDNSLRFLRHYDDAGESGTKSDRKGLQSLLASARNKEFHHVVVNDLTRFGRSAKDLLTNSEELQNNGVTLHSVKDKLDLSTALGRMYF